jgi:hypothetical protein
MAEDFKQLSQRFYDALNAGDMDGAMSLIAEDFRDHGSSRAPRLTAPAHADSSR